MDAFIFDMDGVIVDSERHWKSLEGFFLKSLVPGWRPDDQGKIIGLSIHDLYRMLTEEYGLRRPKEDFLALYHGMAEEIYGEKASIIPGFTELLSQLENRGTPIALASSSPRAWINIVLDRFDLRGSFRAVVSADELEGGAGKPSPAIYLLTASRLGVPSKGCVVMEDSRNGVLSARNAAMFCIGFRNGFNEEQDLSQANVLVSSYSQIDLDAIEGAMQLSQLAPPL